MKVQLSIRSSASSILRNLRQCHNPQPLYSQVLRSFSSSSYLLDEASSSSASKPIANPSIWLSETKARIGKCIMFGMNPEQTAQAGTVCELLGQHWREFIVGRQGFLLSLRPVHTETDSEDRITRPWERGSRAGLYRRGVEWGEMDCMNHVNNVTYTRWAESARVNWTNIYGTHIDPVHKIEWSELCTPKGDGLILKSIRVDYKFPLTYGDRVTVLHKLNSLPDSQSSSFQLDVIILSEKYQRIAATCSEDIVVYDYKLGKKVAIRDFMMDAFRKTWDEQLVEKARVEKEIQDIDTAVRTLELNTWDREDAKEDFGGVK